MIMIIVITFFLLIGLWNNNVFSTLDWIGTMENIECESFEERILWSSDYAYHPEGSTKYQTWYPKHNCTEVRGKNCFLSHVEIETRFLYSGEDDEETEGYVQISNPDESICENPEQGTYSQYLAHEDLHGQIVQTDWHCGDNKNPEKECDSGLFDEFGQVAPCYGIKAFSGQKGIVDVFRIKYALCWRENE